MVIAMACVSYVSLPREFWWYVFLSFLYNIEDVGFVFIMGHLGIQSLNSFKC